MCDCTKGVKICNKQSQQSIQYKKIQVFRLKTNINTCKPMAVLFQCMTKFTTNKKINKKKKKNKIPKKKKKKKNLKENSRHLSIILASLLIFFFSATIPPR